MNQVLFYKQSQNGTVISERLFDPSEGKLITLMIRPVRIVSPSPSQEDASKTANTDGIL